ncbi:MAG: nucleotidyltransferase domain-containing protein [Candidatus Aminicenantes bacterium]|nr:nucleotidyltransferase domain-containing protein [Candidatus Aminicenantes bacterium]
MAERPQNVDTLIWFLSERAKELNCLYTIEELLNRPDTNLEDICRGVIEAVPPGWQYPDVCTAKIELEGNVCQSPHFQETAWVQFSDIKVQEKKVGRLSVYYTKEMPHADDGPFLKEETKLLSTIAERLGHYLLYNRMKLAYREFQSARQAVSDQRLEEWRVALNFLRRTNRNLFLGISRRMLNFLSWRGIEEAEKLLLKSVPGLKAKKENRDDDNRPSTAAAPAFDIKLSDEIFRLAAKHLSSDEILTNIQKWIQEDRLNFLLQVTNRNISLVQVVDAIRKYHHIAAEGIELPAPSKRGILVSLIRRFFSDQQHYINTAVENVNIEDFHEILDHIVFPAESLGRLGGKSAGLFLAKHSLRNSRELLSPFGDIKVPKTWYITSDGLLSFLSHNNLDEIGEQKYKDINQVRLEYPHLIQTFKNSRFPTDIIHGLSMVLDEFKDQPIIVRSSSLLEDRMGASFSGKYKSLFLANQGSKKERLEALKEAVAEVYASTYGPDPVGYRAEHGLLDFPEEMGIMIQEVVGSRVGEYFFPSFAGVVFSRNEFRWSPRINREDGLLRLVPGLGTRAVDRMGDDYPVLIAPGQVGFRVNITADEIVRYAPRKMDVLNLKTNSFETIEIRELLRSYGGKIPAIEKMISLFDGQSLRRPMGRAIDFGKEEAVVTFDGLIHESSFIAQLKTVMNILEEKLQSPVDIEFASDGRSFYLLQYRPQSYGERGGPAHIPRDLPEERIVFLANRFISDGSLPDITHVVFVDPQAYHDLERKASLLDVGRAVGRLNKLLPRRRFVLMGPGRWGSRGDIKLGVKVTYSDISNTAALLEIAQKKGGCLPDLSFGTHFFQDLVESQIRYIPLYPEEPGAVFREKFFRESPNILPGILPEFTHLAGVLRVIDIPRATGGMSLRILMNADLDKAVGFLVNPEVEPPLSSLFRPHDKVKPENHWAWRLEMAEYIASVLDAERFGVQALYVIGSVKNATAGPQSDIDLLVHFRGTSGQQKDLMIWFEGWSLCLDEINYQKTGLRSRGLLDVHFVTNEDIAKRSSYAVKIDAATDAARPLKLKGTS